MSWSSGASSEDPDDTLVASGTSVVAQLRIAAASGVSGTSSVPDAPKRTAAKLESAYAFVTSSTACLAAFRRVVSSSEPYVASLTAIEPVTSTAITTSVLFTARLVVDTVMLGPSAIAPTVRQISMRRTHESIVSSPASPNVWRTTSTIASASITSAIVPPTGQPSRGEKVNVLIASTSRRAAAIW